MRPNPATRARAPQSRPPSRALSSPYLSAETRCARASRGKSDGPCAHHSYFISSRSLGPGAVKTPG